jgi:hypothetical protein
VQGVGSETPVTDRTRRRHEEGRRDGLRGRTKVRNGGQERRSIIIPGACLMATSLRCTDHGVRPAHLPDSRHFGPGLPSSRLRYCFLNSAKSSPTSPVRPTIQHHCHITLHHMPVLVHKCGHDRRKQLLTTAWPRPAGNQLSCASNGTSTHQRQRQTDHLASGVSCDHFNVHALCWQATTPLTCLPLAGGCNQLWAYPYGSKSKRIPYVQYLQRDPIPDCCFV